MFNDLSRDARIQRIEALQKDNEALEQRCQQYAQELENTQWLLRRQQEHMHSLQNFLEEVAYKAKLDGELMELSPSIEKISGYRVDELVGTNVLDYYLHAEQRDGYVRALREQGEVREYPIVLRTKDGREINFSMNSRIVSGNSHEEAYIEGVMTDRTEHFRLLDALKKARDDALVASKAKSDFLATMSHELRTPIHGVMGMLDFLSQETLTDAQKEYVSSAQYSAKVLHDQVNNILDLSKVESGAMQLTSEMFSLKICAYTALNTLIYQAKEKGLSLTCVWEHVPECIQGDALRLRQILLNLLGNAIKFTQTGFVRLHFDGTSEGQLRIAVEDSGIGLSASEQARVFEPFTQGDSSTTRLYQGTGLGTTIAKKLVALMGGDLQVQSEKGQGSCFYCSLPLLPASEQRLWDTWDMMEFRLREELPLRGEKPMTQHAMHGLKVLVADDDPIGLKIIRRNLLRSGCAVTTAVNGREAWQWAQKQTYDLILLDMQMPYWDGVAVTKAIRAREVEHKEEPVPIIGLSAHALDEVVARCMQAGMTTFLIKPIQMDAVLDVLEQQCQIT